MLKKIMLKLINPVVDEYLNEMFSNEYSKNPYIGVTLLQKLGTKNVIDAQLRAETGKILKLPYGSNIVLSPWEKILLNPRQIFEFPTEKLSDISMEIVIGKNCKKPLKLSMPIMITGMSYGGSLALKMKIALAMGSKKAGISTNTGESTVIKEVRKHAKYVIGQVNRANLMSEEDFPLLDAIEIRLGQGAWGGNVESTTYAKDIDERLRDDWHLKKGENVIFHSHLKDINNKDDLINYVSSLKQKYDIPIGIKIAASDFIEQELAIITSTKCDYIVIDGCEGGTAVAPPTLADNVGLPTLYALVRAVNYLEKNNIKDRYDLIITGGLSTPGHFLKALALGANAVYIGSIAILATVHNQAIKAVPQMPPTELVLNTGIYKDKLKVSLAAKSLYNFLISCNEEMKLALQAMAKKHISELSVDDLVTVDKNLSDYTKIRYGFNNRR